VDKYTFTQNVTQLTQKPVHFSLKLTDLKQIVSFLRLANDLNWDSLCYRVYNAELKNDVPRITV